MGESETYRDYMTAQKGVLRGLTLVTKFYHDSITEKKNRLHLNNEDIFELNKEADEIAKINIQHIMVKEEDIGLPNDLMDVEEFINGTTGLMEWYSAMNEVFLDKIHEQQEKKKVKFFDHIKNNIKNKIK